MVQADAKLEQRTATRQLERHRVRSLSHSRAPGRRQRSIPPRTARYPSLDPGRAERLAELDEESARRIAWDSVQACGTTVRDDSNARYAPLAGLLGWTVLDSTHARQISPEASKAMGAKISKPFECKRAGGRLS